jgi:hypothetical protein
MSTVEADREEEALRAALADAIDRTLTSIDCDVEQHLGLVDELRLGDARLTFRAHCDPVAGYPIGVYEWAEYEPAEDHVQHEVAHGAVHSLGEVLGHVSKRVHDHNEGLHPEVREVAELTSPPFPMGVRCPPRTLSWWSTTPTGGRASPSPSCGACRSASP